VCFGSALNFGKEGKKRIAFLYIRFNNNDSSECKLKPFNVGSAMNRLVRKAEKKPRTFFMFKLSSYY